MCGIFGIYSQDEENLEVTSLKFSEKSLALMLHRGPDAASTELISPNLIFCFCRLAICDLDSRAMQPMVSGRSSMIFNGEIYNHLELRKDLESKGEYFQTTSDTEVLQRIIDLYGIAGLAKVNGMFAIAYFDKSNEELLLIRDRFGVKPLYYCQKSNLVAFGSEVKTLLPLVDTMSINPPYLANFLLEGHLDGGNQTLITEISQVEAGTCVSIKGNNIEIQKWYSLEKKTRNKRLNIDEFEERLLDSISLRIRSDVPICMTLSGGLDSTVIYTLIKERLGIPIHIFTYDLPNSGDSELELVKSLTNKYGDQLTVISESDSREGITRKSLQADLEDTEFPIWSFSSRAYKQIYKCIHEKGFRVVIEGHGADEILGGYPYLIRAIALEGFYRKNLISGLRALGCYQASLGNEFEIKKFVKDAYAFRLNSKNALEGQLFDAEIRKVTTQTILPTVLRTFDRLSMRYSIESRAPFMDYRFIEYCSSIRGIDLISRMGAKAPLRRILRKYGNSKVGNNPKKLGFSSNLQEIFLNSNLRSELSSFIEKDSVIGRQYPTLWRETQEYLTEGIFHDSKNQEAMRFLLAEMFNRGINQNL